MSFDKIFDLTAGVYFYFNDIIQGSYARSEYHTQLANMSFDKIFDLTAGVYFYFNNIIQGSDGGRLSAAPPSIIVAQKGRG